MTVTEQIENLKKKAPPVWVGILFFLVGIITFFTGILTPYSYLIILGFFVMFGSLQFYYAGTNAKNALMALHDGIKKSGRVFIYIDESDTYPAYYAKAMSDDKYSWDYSFDPFHWEPVAGLNESELIFNKDKEWPVLLIIKNGIIYPKVKPIKNSDSDILLPLMIKISEKMPNKANSA